MDLQTFAALLAPAGQALLVEVAERAEHETDLALGTQLRRAHPTGLVAATMTQHRLRQRATSKFGDDAQLLYFTPESLEQATRGSVAAHRAARLNDLGATSLVDLGCGIGGDLIASARVGIAVRGIELDPVRAAIAQANLDALGLPGTVEVGDATEATISNGEIAFIDPARRDGAGRTFTLDALVPEWGFITGLLRGRTLTKVMPGIAHAAVPAGVQPEWVSDGGNLVEACLWGAGFDLPTQRRATVLPAGLTLVGRGTVATTGDPLSHLIEPDDAVIRAGLVAELAEDLGGHLLDPHIAWITADAPVSTNFGRTFRIEAELPFREKQLRAALRSLDVGVLTVKKRGVDIVPEHLIARLKLTGSKAATIVLTRVAGEGRAFLVERER